MIKVLGSNKGGPIIQKSEYLKKKNLQLKRLDLEFPSSLIP